MKFWIQIKYRARKYIISLFILLYTFIACTNHISESDVEVFIIRTWTESRRAVVQYTVTNIGDIVIRGWKVSFYINLESSPQLVAVDNVYSILYPGDISLLERAEILIPSYYGEFNGAFLKHIDTW